MRKVLLDDNDRIWNAYRYEHILTTICKREREGDLQIASLKEAAKRFLESTQESKVYERE